MTSLDLGPWTWSGPTSGSEICTSSPALTATPRHHSSTSESASDSQKWFSSSRIRTGSLMMPPCWSVMKAYLHCPTSHLWRLRGVSMLVKVKASGPVISTWRSAPPTSHSVTPSSSCQYSSTGSR